MQSKRARGFTLIELMIVIALMAGLATMVAVQIVGRMDSVKTATAAREVMATLRAARAQALFKQESRAVLFDTEKRSYTPADGVPVALPRTMEVQLFTADQEVLSASEGAIRFYPDGGSTGGSVSLSSDGRTWKIAVGWLTGDIAIEDSARPRAPGR